MYIRKHARFKESIPMVQAVGVFKDKPLGYGNPPRGYGKRTVDMYLKEGKPFFSPEEFIEILKKKSWEYSLYNSPDKIERLISRDKALVSFFVLSCARISEVVQVRRSQIDLSESEWLKVKNFRVMKRKKGRIETIPILAFTRKPDAILEPFSSMFLEHTLRIRGDKPIFKIGTRRARGIITDLHPDLFPHFIRGCALTYYVNLMGDPLGTARAFGLKKVETLMKYYGKTWEAFKEEFAR